MYIYSTYIYIYKLYIYIIHIYIYIYIYKDSLQHICMYTHSYVCSCKCISLKENKNAKGENISI